MQLLDLQSERAHSFKLREWGRGGGRSCAYESRCLQRPKVLDPLDLESEDIVSQPVWDQELSSDLL